MYVLIAGGILLLCFFVFISYVKAPPSFAFIISGLSSQPRVLIGKGGFRIPFLTQEFNAVFRGDGADTPVPGKNAAGGQTAAKGADA